MPDRDEHADKNDDPRIQPPPEHLPARVHDDEHDDAADFDAVRIKRPAENRTLAIWAHWGGLLGWILVPMIFYVIEKDKRSLAAWHARESLNFQITMTIYYLLGVPLLCLVFMDIWFLLAGIALEGLLAALELIAIIFASLAASRGQRYRYPLTIPFIPRPSDEPNPYDDRQ